MTADGNVEFTMRRLRRLISLSPKPSSFRTATQDGPTFSIAAVISSL